MSISKILYDIIKSGGSKLDMLEAAEHYDLVLMEEAGEQPSGSNTVIYLRDGLTCAYCGTVEGPFAIDHIHPRSRGGTDWLRNLTVACRSCNCSKGAKSLSEWLFGLPKAMPIMLSRAGRK